MNAPAETGNAGYHNLSRLDLRQLIMTNRTTETINRYPTMNDGKLSAVGSNPRGSGALPSKNIRPPCHRLGYACPPISFREAKGVSREDEGSCLGDFRIQPPASLHRREIVTTCRKIPPVSFDRLGQRTCELGNIEWLQPSLGVRFKVGFRSAKATATFGFVMPDSLRELKPGRTCQF